MTTPINIHTVSLFRKTTAAIPLLLLGWNLCAQTTPADTTAPAASDTTTAIKAPPPKNTVPVTGTITESVSGKPLRGVRITYRDLYAAITDSAGTFSINVPGYQVVIRIEADGYQSKEIALRGAASVN